MSSPTITIEGDTLIRNGRRYLKTGPGLWTPRVPTVPEMGATLTEADLRSGRPLAAVRRRARRERKAP